MVEQKGKIQQQQMQWQGVDLTQGILLELQPKDNMAYYIIAINQQPCRATRYYYFTAKQYPTQTKTTDDTPYQEMNVQLTILPAPMNRNFYVYNQSEWQRLSYSALTTTYKSTNAKTRIATNSAQLANAMKYYQDKIDKKFGYYQGRLTTDEIKRIQAQGNNITLFIHGYCVDYGDYSTDFEIGLSEDSGCEGINKTPSVLWQ